MSRSYDRVRDFESELKDVPDEELSVIEKLIKRGYGCLTLGQLQIIKRQAAYYRQNRLRALQKYSKISTEMEK